MVRIISLLMMCCSMIVSADAVLKDPTQPYSMQAETSAVFVQKIDFKVTSILKRKNVAWAIVNGVKANVGERVGGAKIVKIAYDKVLLDVGDSHRWVLLSNNSGLKKSR